MNKILDKLRADLESTGLKPGTPDYEKEEVLQKVELCKKFNRVGSCWDCPKFDHCELTKKNLRNMYSDDKKGTK